jgi:hypothetical protein
MSRTKFRPKASEWYFKSNALWMWILVAVIGAVLGFAFSLAYERVRPNLWQNVALASFGAILISAIVLLLNNSRELTINQDILMAAVRDRLQLSQESPSSAAKRQLLASMGPQTYYYLDPHQIGDLYAQLAAEPSSIEIEEERSTSTGIVAKLRLLEPRYGRDSTIRKLEKYEDDKAVSQKYRVVQEQMFAKQGLVTFGIEDFEHKVQPVDDLRAILSDIEKEVSSLLDTEEILEELARQTGVKAARERRNELQKVSGFVATHADYVPRWHTEQECSLYLQHQINEYLPGLSPETVIRIVCNADFLTPSGRDAFTEGVATRITCLGKVIRWHSQTGQLVISPIGVS